MTAPATRGPGAAAVGAPELRLERLTARDFRNFARLDLTVPPDGLAVIGENGQGKTNLLEAIYYLQLLRSMRGARDVDLVRFESAGFHLGAEIAGARTTVVGVGFERAGRRKKVVLDGREVGRLSDALGTLPSVIVSPADIQLVAGGPSERRRYLDVTLALSSRRYLGALQSYRAALGRRNASLREVARLGGGRGEDRVAVWEPGLAEHGATLWQERARWVRERAEEFRQLCERIGERGIARMTYANGIAQRSDVSMTVDREDASAPALDELREILASSLATRRSHEIRRGVTMSGPHRDDLEITLDGREIRSFGSAGQQRTAAIALRMLEAATLRAARDTDPLLLLDDPFAELDGRRARRILELLGEGGIGQVILAVPRPGDIPPALSRLERRIVRDGEFGSA